MPLTFSTFMISLIKSIVFTFLIFCMIGCGLLYDFTCLEKGLIENVIVNKTKYKLEIRTFNKGRNLEIVSIPKGDSVVRIVGGGYINQFFLNTSIDSIHISSGNRVLVQYCGGESLHIKSELVTDNCVGISKNLLWLPTERYQVNKKVEKQCISDHQSWTFEESDFE